MISQKNTNISEATDAYRGRPEDTARNAGIAGMLGSGMSGRIWTPPDCKRVWQTLVQGSQLLTYIRLPYAA